MLIYFIEAQSILRAHIMAATALHFFICACLGSYFNVFAWRWPQIQERQWLEDVYDWFEEKKWPKPQATLPCTKKLSLSHPSSFCPSCMSPIPIWLNVPVLGWIALRGKARCCSTTISFKYPLFEFSCGLVGAFAWIHYQNLWPAELFLLFAMPLFMASQTDLESMLLPDSINGFILYTGLGLAIFGWGHVDAQVSFIGACAGYGLLSVVRILGRLAFRKEAMGQGDPKLLAAMGGWLGLMALPQVLLMASLSGLLYALALKVFSEKSGPIIPFGPFLALGGIIAYVWPIGL